MYIVQKYKQDHGYDSDDKVHSNWPDKLKGLRIETKKAEKQLQHSWVVYATLRVSPRRRKVLKE